MKRLKPSGRYASSGPPVVKQPPLWPEPPRETEFVIWDEDLEAEDLSIDEDEEPSADDEVDLATDDDDLGVAKGEKDEES